ncbi:methyl-accepting chemotaxis protein [Undibacterium sp. Di24W]|uniref:methyl-accepting chemotaxis protein n=1 Tax=Undibacterium sp. Di24W TaxID=3413033 RepID=UPI003BF17F64
MKIATRLILLISSLAMVCFIVSGIGLYGLVKSNDAILTIYADRTVPAVDIGKIQTLVVSNRLEIAMALLEQNPESARHAVQQLESNITNVNKIWDAYMATYLTPEEAKLASDFATRRARYVQEGLRPTITALQAGDFAQAQSLMLEKVSPLMLPVKEKGDDLLQLQMDVAKEEFDAAIARFELIRLTEILVTVLGLTGAIVFGWMTVRYISRQLGGEPIEVARIAQAIAQGDLTQEIALKNDDQSSLLFSMKEMNSNLANVVSQVRGATDTIATSSSQIATGNMDLSSRTEEQASSLEETAASLEELTSNVRQNADNAREASQLASSASEVAVKSSSVVAEVVSTMGSINDSSKRIVDIISVIDGIAFQTNILALNAAVEAARAGEQGRGFAVVASEVRGLAQRSASAAKEIKSLIDHSVQQVNLGAKLVDEAGITMHEVVNSVQRVADIITDISNASHEQSTGIDQINVAISSMDNVTQQNAALVEEAAAAAAALEDQAEQLSGLVNTFKLNDIASLSPASNRLSMTVRKAHIPAANLSRPLKLIA